MTVAALLSGPGHLLVTCRSPHSWSHIGTEVPVEVFTRADSIALLRAHRPELDRLTFLDAQLRSAVRTLAGTPDVGPDFQSSAPELYFVGPAVAPTFGPVMRFVYGADYAARTVTRALTTIARPRSTVGTRR